MTSPTSKENLRQSLRQARDSYARALDPAERAGLEAAAVGRLRAVLGPGVWASYLAMGSEISPARVADNAPPDQPIAFPWFESREAPMLFRSGGGVFSSGPFGIRQPPGTAPEMRPDWIIVPLVGVDPAGNRIGQGAGHYDRALQSLREDGRVTTIGLAWDVQLVDSIAADPWDQPLDLIITPSRTIRTRP